MSVDNDNVVPLTSHSSNEAIEEMGEDSGQDIDEQFMDALMDTGNVGEGVVQDEVDDDVEDKVDEVECPPDHSLIGSLVYWAFEFGITLVSLTTLLSILRFHHPTLPKDTRTLLQS